MTTQFYLRLLLSSTVLITCCQKEADVVPPYPQISYYPLQGDTTTFFCFDGTGSTDNMSEIWQLQFRWDFNGDGAWDTEWSREPKAVNKFSRFGIDSVFLQVIDHAGLTGTSHCAVNIAPNFVDSLFTDPRDGNLYRAVRIDQMWWMAENLRYGVEIAKGTLPKNDGIAEKFIYRDSLNQPVTESGYYNWNEATDYGKFIVNGICPSGWRLMNYSDADYLYKRFFFYDSRFYLDASGYVGIDFLSEGFYSFFSKGFSYFGDVGFWIISQRSSTETLEEHYILNYGIKDTVGMFNFTYSIPREYIYYPFWWNKEEWGEKMDFNKIGVNVRCVKKIAN